MGDGDVEMVDHDSFQGWQIKSVRGEGSHAFGSPNEGRKRDWASDQVGIGISSKDGINLLTKIKSNGGWANESDIEKDR